MYDGRVLQFMRTSVLNFSVLIDNHPTAIYKLLSTMHAKPLTMYQLLDLFETRYSDEGSNQCTTEEMLMHNFYSPIEECEDEFLMW